MTGVALVLWIVTAVGGFTMAGIWLAHHGPAQHREGVAHIAPRRLASHFALAAAGLLLWIIHASTENESAGWVALALLPIVAVLGLLMLMNWLAARGAAVVDEPPAEQHIPPIVVAAHGLFAVATVITVFIALVA